MHDAEWVIYRQHRPIRKSVLYEVYSTGGAFDTPTYDTINIYINIYIYIYIYVTTNMERGLIYPIF